MTLKNLTTEEIGRLLEQGAGQVPIVDRFPSNYFNTDPRSAAVLVPLYRHLGEWYALFIRRAANEKDRHSGQVAFPGGRVDPGDLDEIGAALRETREEVGLSERQISVLGSLNPYRTVSNYLVTPVVAEIEWPAAVSPDPREVERIFSIPLRWLADPANCQVRTRVLPGFDVNIPVYYFERFENELLWGITAKIVVTLLNVLRVDGYWPIMFGQEESR